MNQSLGLRSNRNRICVDLRGLNDILGPTPKVKMPRTSLLKENAYGSHLTSFDMTMFYYGIKLAQDSKKYTNFWFNNKSFCHTCLPMGLKSSPFYVQMISEKIFSNDNLAKFCEIEGLELGSVDFPFKDVEEFRIVYIDDLLIHTLKILGLAI